ncbi:MFS transporter [Streptomyces sp. NPDC087440]|uniref:MFS transporter n=1 Tax=Streptomyces sp. NPDC087440 TaxID=3365790 RepID=UPI00381D3CC1
MPRALVRTGRALALLAGTQFLLILDTSVINVAAPSMGRELAIPPAALSWVANAYLVSFGGLLLLSGRAADLLGRRRVFASGLAVLVAASLLGTLADSAALLIAARTAQGVGAAMAAASALALLLMLYEDGPGRHRALGVFAAMAGAGGAAGTVLGGVLTSWFGWESTFALNVVAGLLLLVAALRLLPEGRAERDGRGIDLPGAATVTGGLALLAYAVVSAGEAGWSAPQTLGTAAGAVLLLAAFVAIERRAAAPLVPLDIFTRRTLRTANMLAALWQTALFPMFFLVSLYLQTVLGYDAVGGGLGLLPLSLTVVLVAGGAGRLIGRFGLRAVMCAGFVLIAVGMGWLSRISAAGSFVGDVLPPSLLLGVALPLAAVTTQVAATAGTSDDEAGLASGLVNTSLQFGSVIGLAALSGIAAARTAAGGDLTEGIGAAFLAGAVVAVVGALVAARLRTPVPV